MLHARGGADGAGADGGDRPLRLHALLCGIHVRARAFGRCRDPAGIRRDGGARPQSRCLLESPQHVNLRRDCTDAPPRRAGVALRRLRHRSRRGENMTLRRPVKHVLPGAVQHRTAGPYSPVIEVDARRLVVLSGQVAVGPAAELGGDAIEEQPGRPLEPRRRELGTAGPSLNDVFKVNGYLSDLGEWSRFNAVCEAALSAPVPVRTAVQAVLLPPFRVEIEMWA